jgi:hypothetical protein
MPVWITCHWKVFRAMRPTAEVIVSDWSNQKEPGSSLGQEQTFDLLEIQPYRE